MSHDAFISYASADLAHAKLVYERLTAAGFAVWFDKARLREGCNWHREIEAGCESSRVVLPILTRRWKESLWTRYETYGAESIIPLIAEGDWREVATPPLRAIQIHPVHLPERRDEDWQGLFETIRATLAQRSPQKAERIAHLRYHSNPYFVGREADLNEIHEKLFTNPTTALTQRHVTAVAALGGVGKTTLAREYAEKFWRCYPQMFWVDCRRGIESEFAVIHDILRPESQYRELKDFDKATWVLAELRQLDRPPRLLVIDNAEDEESVTPWLPNTGRCHTIITSRFTRWSPGVEVCSVWVLQPDPARELLLRRAAREESTVEIADCNTLANKLEYLPLALEQAAAYVAEQGPGYRFADYLRLSAEHGHDLKLLGGHASGSTEYPDSVFLTWRTTVDKLSPGAKAILRLCSFMAPASIPTDMLIKGAAIVGREAGVTGVGELEIRAWKSALAGYSMIQLAERNDSFSIHGLVQAVERSWVPRDQRPVTIKRSVDLLMSWVPIPSFEFENWPDWKLILPHAQRLWEQRQIGDEADSNLTFLVEFGSFLQTQGDYAYAKQILGLAFEVSSRVLGEDHPGTLRSLNSLALLYVSQGRYGAAESLFQRALRDNELVLGVDHPSTLVVVSNLAGSLEKQGRYKEAKPLFERALRNHERVFGVDHPNTVRLANSLGSLCGKLGSYDEAERLLQRAVGDSERVLGVDHPETLRAANNLGFLYETTGRCYQAEPLYLRALRDREIVLGAEHPDTLVSVNNLANLYAEQRRYAEAEPLYERAVRDKEQVLGMDHPETLISVSNLAICYGEEGRYADAEPLYRRAAEGFRRVLGEKHPDTIKMVAYYHRIRQIRRLPAWLQRLLR